MKVLVQATRAGQASLVLSLEHHGIAEDADYEHAAEEIRARVDTGKTLMGYWEGSTGRLVMVEFLPGQVSHIVVIPEDDD